MMSYRRISHKKYFEDYAYVLDYLPYGYPYPVVGRGGIKRGPIAQAVGEMYFMLLELEPYRGIPLNVGEKVFVGKGMGGKIRKVVRRIRYDELTAAAKDELESVIEKIVAMREREFIEFFNKSEPITTRMHSLELLRGIGKKTLWRILDGRKKRPFTSFADIQSRVKIDPKRLVVERIIEELKGGQKYYIFTAPP